jgi:probable selenate reductase FAD-binding subunit
MVQAYYRPETLEEALGLLGREKDARLLAGGSYLLSPRFKDRAISAIAISSLLPQGIERRKDSLIIGAGICFQSLADSSLVPEALRQAALGMANRNVRNRATVGGNIGADRSCSSLLPFFLVAEAIYHRAGSDPIPAQRWREAPPGIITAVEFPLPAGRSFAYGRYSRSACDLALIGCAVRADLGAGRLDNLRVALGGLSAHAQRYPGLEASLEGKPLPPKAELEEMAQAFFSPIDDLRGSAAFKRRRAAVLLADLLGSLKERRL